MNQWIWNRKTALLLAGVGAGCSLAFRMLVEQLGIPGYQQAEQELLAGTLWVRAVVLTMVSPLVEEIIFRKFLYGWMKRWMPLWGASVSSALCFGLYHGNLAQGLYAFGMGLFLAWSMERFRTLKAPIVIHAAANAVGVLAGILTSVM